MAKWLEQPNLNCRNTVVIQIPTYGMFTFTRNNNQQNIKKQNLKINTRIAAAIECQKSCAATIQASCSSVLYRAGLELVDISRVSVRFGSVGSVCLVWFGSVRKEITMLIVQ